MDLLNKYEIWSEGYATSGESDGAMLHGNGTGKTFRDACIGFFKGDEYFYLESMSYWGCKLYDNEQEARKEFG